MADKATLLSIIAYARSGATGYAWRLVREAGLDRADTDPAALSVVARLLKDEALRSTGEGRQRFFAESSAAYSRAAEISGDTYPLINAATLALLAGRRPQAEILARQVLGKQDRHEDLNETPYWRGATRAEALILLGDMAQAKVVLSDALLRAPRAFEDHASTLRQFGFILDEIGVSRRWLDPFRPKRCLHFAGHMGMDPNDRGLAEKIRAITTEERIGFGFGALAAGADILVAEALLEQDTELHVLLPATPAVFREISVSCRGEDWAARFDRVLSATESVRVINTGSNPISPAALQIATEVAIGRAVMQARVLETEAVQLVVLDGTEAGDIRPGSSHWTKQVWQHTGLRQHVLEALRVRSATASAVCEDIEGSQEQLAAVLRIELTQGDATFLSKDVVAQLERAIRGVWGEVIALQWASEGLLAAIRTPRAAANAALSVFTGLAGSSELRIAGHYGIFSWMADPFSSGPIFVGPSAAMPRRILASTPPGAIHITEDFAAALHVGPANGRPRTEYVGELPALGGGTPSRLFALAK